MRTTSKLSGPRSIKSPSKTTRSSLDNSHASNNASSVSENPWTSPIAQTLCPFPSAFCRSFSMSFRLILLTVKVSILQYLKETQNKSLKDCKPMIKQPKRVGNAYDGRSSGMTAKAPIWACRSVGRSLPWHGRGPEFKSRHVHHLSRFYLIHGGLAP